MPNRRTTVAGGCAAATLAIALAGAGAAAPKGGEVDLLQNGDFEAGVAGWRVLNLSGGVSFEPDEKVRKSGKQALRITRTGAGANDWLKQSAPLPGGTREVRATCAFKVDKGARAEVAVFFFDAKEETVGKGYVDLVRSGATRKWETAEERLDVPKGAVGVGVNVKVTAPGTFWLDDLRLTVEGGGPGLRNGGFEAGLDGWRPIADGSDATTAAADAAVRAEGKSAARLVRTSARLLPEDGLVADVTDVSPGKQRLRFQARTDEGARAAVAVQAIDDRGVCVATARATAGGKAKAFAEGSVVLDVPREAKRLRVSLIVSGAGTAWFDGLALGAEK